jgi:hypothetical protein
VPVVRRCRLRSELIHACASVSPSRCLGLAAARLLSHARFDSSRAKFSRIRFSFCRCPEAAFVSCFDFVLLAQMFFRSLSIFFGYCSIRASVSLLRCFCFCGELSPRAMVHEHSFPARAESLPPSCFPAQAPVSALKDFHFPLLVLVANLGRSWGSVFAAQCFSFPARAWIFLRAPVSFWPLPPAVIPEHCLMLAGFFTLSFLAAAGVHPDWHSVRFRFAIFISRVACARLHFFGRVLRSAVSSVTQT